MRNDSGAAQAGRQWAAEKSAELQHIMKELETVLALGCKERPLSWDALKDETPFRTKQPSPLKAIDLPPRPANWKEPPAPAESPEPRFFTPELVIPVTSRLDAFTPGRKRKLMLQAEVQNSYRYQEASKDFQQAQQTFEKQQQASRQQRMQRDQAHAEHQQTMVSWTEQCTRLAALHARRERQYEAELNAWRAEKSGFLHAQCLQHAWICTQQEKYRAGMKDAVEYFLREVLKRSKHIQGYSSEFALIFLHESKLCVLDYELPSKSMLPEFKEARYIANRGQLQYSAISESWKRITYDSLLYQTALGAMHRIFLSDDAALVHSIVFNGWVTSIDPATGANTRSCILSVQAGRDEFMCLDLTRVDPKACFRSLKGVAASKLAELTPIKPIASLNKTDPRFIEGYTVAHLLDKRTNLAAIDWQDFENLIREIFEKQFRQNGGEVKITQASHDGGVDAVAFDPDPIRGGKIVIQAKRYTNTVGVSAVRDLFGTIQHEGAMKGILVTTATFGSDAYEFAKDKPITLLSGAELLSMLESHGHQAKIDIAEAKARR